MGYLVRVKINKTRDDVERLLQDGLRPMAICIALNIRPCIVSYYRKLGGFRKFRGGGTRTPEVKRKTAQARRMMAAGVSYGKIAAHFLVTKNRVYQWLNRRKHATRCKTHAAIKDGRLQRPKHCQKCLKRCKPHAHHLDYSKPLLVKWLCSMCHSKIHHKDMLMAINKKAMAAIMRQIGKIKSKAKANASRKNGRKGGRPANKTTN